MNSPVPLRRPVAAAPPAPAAGEAITELAAATPTATAAPAPGVGELPAPVAGEVLPPAKRGRPLGRPNESQLTTASRLRMETDCRKYLHQVSIGRKVRAAPHIGADFKRPVYPTTRERTDAAWKLARLMQADRAMEQQPEGGGITAAGVGMSVNIRILQVAL